MSNSKLSGQSFVYEHFNDSVNNLVNNTVEFEMPRRVTDKPHVFLGVNFLNSSGDVVVPSAGTYDVKVETSNNPGFLQEIPFGTDVDATMPTTLSVAANVTKVLVESRSITGADTFSLIVTANLG